MPDLTISEAARLCGVHRRTLQRAIRAGRLRLTPDAQLTTFALEQAGYTAAVPQDTTHRTAGDMAPRDAAVPQVLERIADALTRMATSMEVLCERLTPQRHAVPEPQMTPHRSAPHTPQQDTAPQTAAAPQETPPTFDGAKYRLGKLCKAGHDWQSTGQSLRVNNKAGYCLACNAEDARVRRQARRHARLPPP